VLIERGVKSSLIGALMRGKEEKKNQLTAEMFSSFFSLQKLQLNKLLKIHNTRWKSLQ
jgi:hypothetical protein